jgi:hypothetical protein
MAVFGVWEIPTRKVGIEDRNRFKSRISSSAVILVYHLNVYILPVPISNLVSLQCANASWVPFLSLIGTQVSN